MPPTPQLPAPPFLLPRASLAACDVASVATLATLAVTLGCGPGSRATVAERDDGSLDHESTSASDGEPLDDSSSEGEDVRVWPEESLGMYYYESRRSLGIRESSIFSPLTNLELQRDVLRVTLTGCNGSVDRVDYPVSFEGDEVHVVPEPGETHVMWFGAPWAKALIFRPGPTCETLQTELVEPVYSNVGPTWTWLRGAIYVSEPCENGTEWAADLVPGVPTDCG